jgi:hypothetical protein
MVASPDMRASRRVPIGNRVRVISNGRIVTYVVALNLGLGGVLLKAQSPLPIGSSCKVSILPPDGAPDREVSVEGRVIREDGTGTAVQFAAALAEERFEAVVAPVATAGPRAVLEAYRTYFRVSRTAGLENCESLLGVTKAQFRRVFYSTFSGSIVLAVLPVWFLRASIPAYPNGVKILLAFAYGALWLMLLQPAADLAIFRWLRRRTS